MLMPAHLHGVPVGLQGARGLAQAAEKEVKLPPQHGIPGRYAAALYMAALKTDSLQKVEGELSQVSSLMAESKDFNAFVGDPSVPRAVKVDGLNSILTKMGATDITKNFVGACMRPALALQGRWGLREKQGSCIANFFLRRSLGAIVIACCRAWPHAAGLLSANNRLSELGKILGKFEEIAADQRGEVKAVVTTAEVGCWAWQRWTPVAIEPRGAAHCWGFKRLEARILLQLLRF